MKEQSTNTQCSRCKNTISTIENTACCKTMLMCTTIYILVVLPVHNLYPSVGFTQHKVCLHVLYVWGLWYPLILWLQDICS
ncbi:hypothetical protein GDO81_025306 [Engystomops pustulosus]|uniref:Uncharacterized protein n=1 Tax=Engystomops pustulosus TaxID=76066 RepID=A0AAV6ZJT7_ENGPU|nr:hypothetical protein GDO81_025306 [Engystomops pustulosus]